jgi:hypothetical protein
VQFFFACLYFFNVNGKSEQKSVKNEQKMGKTEQKIKIKICEKRTKKGGKTNKNP